MNARTSIRVPVNAELYKHRAPPATLNLRKVPGSSSDLASFLAPPPWEEVYRWQRRAAWMGLIAVTGWAATVVLLWLLVSR